MKINYEPALDFSDVLLQPKRSSLKSRSEVDLFREFSFINCDTAYEGIPIIAANMDTVATFSMAEALQSHYISTALHKHYSVEEYVRFFTQQKASKANEMAPVFYTTGISESDMVKLNDIDNQTNIEYLCVDNANGYTEAFYTAISRLRDKYPNVVIMAGNVISPEAGEQLIVSGADIVKCGLGSGSVCLTRRMTGVGLPQLTAIIETADAVHGLKGHVCSDGGCTVPGDVVKAFAGGADFVMLGGMFSGHVETGLPIVDYNGKPHMEFYGMSSASAMDKHVGGVAKYRASEGKSVMIPLKGSIDDTVQELLGGMRSACTYLGAQKLKELTKRATFRKVSRQLNTIYGD